MNIILLHSSNYNYIKTYGPRCLYTINNKSVLDKQIDILNKTFKKNNILVISGFKSKKIRNHIKSYKNVFLIENTDYETTNDLYSLWLGIQYFDNHALIIQDNILFKPCIFDKLNIEQSSLFLSHHQKFELGCIIDQNNNINNISWGLRNYWANISFIENHEFFLLKTICQNPIIKKWFFMEGLNWVIEQGGQFQTNFINTPIISVNKTNVTI